MSELSEHDIRRADRMVENYSTVEFVAIPPDFDIMKYLSMRESAGIFDHKNINLKQLKIMAQSVAVSPIFNVRNNLRISSVTCMFLIKIFKEMGLILKSIHNPLRDGIERHMKQLDDSEQSSLYIKGQNAKRVNFTIVNIFPLMSDTVIQEAMEIAKKLQEYEQEVNEKLQSIEM